MKKSTFTARLISLALIAALMLAGMPVIAVDNATATTAAPAVEAATPVVTETEDLTAEVVTQTETDSIGLLKPGDLTWAELQNATLSAADIPDVLPAAVVQEKQLVNRLYQQEEGLSHLLFQNRSGQKTAFLYARPVKYVADDGSIRDKSTTLIAVNKTYGALGYDYGVEDNSIRQYYSANPSVGLLVEVGEYAIRVLPQAVGSLVVPRGALHENTFVYQNIFGTNTALVYTPRLSGVKEDIILRSYTGISDFSFTYLTNGLSLVDLDGTYTFVNEAGLPYATLGSVLIQDAAGKNATGSVTVTQTAANTYTVTVHADRAFLTAANTAYPVTIDPWIDETALNTETGLYEPAILDYGLYSSTVQPTDKDLYHHLGQLNNTGTGMGRIIYKFPSFIQNSSIGIYAGLTAEEIDTASILIYGISSTQSPDTDVTIYPITTSWSSNSNAFDNTPLFNSCKNGTPAVSSYVTFDGYFSELIVTDIFKAWAAYNNGDTTKPNPANGLVVIADDEVANAHIRKIYTVENPENNVCVVFDYNVMGNFYISSCSSGEFLEVDGDARMAETTPFNDSDGAPTLWCLEYQSDGTYGIRRVGTQHSYLTNFSSMFFPTTMSNGLDKWRLTFVEDDVVVMKNVAWNFYLKENASSEPGFVGSGSTTDITLRWRLVRENKYVDATSVTLAEGEQFIAPGTTENYTVDIAPANATWADASELVWETDNTNFTISATGALTAPASGGIANVTVTHRVSGRSCTFEVKSGFLEDGVYKIKNKASLYFMDILDASLVEGAFINQYSLHGGRQQQWRMQLQADGSYTIQSVLSNYYVAVQDSSVADDANIVQIDGANGLPTCAKWIVTDTENGYSISAAHQTNYVLSAPILFNGKLVQNIQNNNYDLWMFERLDYEITMNIYYDRGFAVRLCLDDVEKMQYYMQGICERVNAYTQPYLNLTVFFSEPRLYESMTDRCKINRGIELNAATVRYTDKTDYLCPDHPLVKAEAGRTVDICTLHAAADANGAYNCTDHISAFQEFISNNPGSGTNVSVLFTGHDFVELKRTDEEGVWEYDLANRCFSIRYPGIPAYGISMQKNDSQQNIANVFAHEISHQVGGKDHYHDLSDFDSGADTTQNCSNVANGCAGCGSNQNSSSARPTGCVMACEYSVTDSIVYCDQCFAEIAMYLYEYF